MNSRLHLLMSIAAVMAIIVGERSADVVAASNSGKAPMDNRPPSARLLAGDQHYQAGLTRALMGAYPQKAAANKEMAPRNKDIVRPTLKLLAGEQHYPAGLTRAQQQQAPKQERKKAAQPNGKQKQHAPQEESPSAKYHRAIQTHNGAMRPAQYGNPSANYHRAIQTHNGAMWPAPYGNGAYAGGGGYFNPPVADVFNGMYNYIFGPPAPSYHHQAPPAGEEMGQPRTINPYAHEPPPFGGMPPGYAYPGQPSANWGGAPPPPGYGQSMPYGPENQGRFVIIEKQKPNIIGRMLGYQTEKVVHQTDHYPYTT